MFIKYLVAVMECLTFYQPMMMPFHCNCKHDNVFLLEKELVEKMGGEEKMMSSGTPLKATTTEDTVNTSVLSSSSADTPIKHQHNEDYEAKPAKIQGEIRKKDPSMAGIKKRKSFGQFQVSLTSIGFFYIEKYSLYHRFYWIFLKLQEANE